MTVPFTAAHTPQGATETRSNGGNIEDENVSKDSNAPGTLSMANTGRANSGEYLRPRPATAPRDRALRPPLRPSPHPAASTSYGCSLHPLRLQPPPPTVAASVTHGCRCTTSLRSPPSRRRRSCSRPRGARERRRPPHPRTRSSPAGPPPLPCLPPYCAVKPAAHFDRVLTTVLWSQAKAQPSTHARYPRLPAYGGQCHR